MSRALPMPHLMMPFVMTFDDRGSPAVTSCRTSSSPSNRASHAVQQLPDFAAPLQVHQQAFAIEEDVSAVQPGSDRATRIGDRRADHPVVLGVAVEAPAQRNHIRLIEVEPQRSWRRREPEHATVQAATEVQDHHVGMAPKEIGAPVIQLLGAQRDQILVRYRQRGPVDALEVIVDAVNGLRGGMVAENGPPRTAFIGAQVQRDQVGPLHRTPCDGTEVNFRVAHPFRLRKLAAYSGTGSDAAGP